MPAALAARFASSTEAAAALVTHSPVMGLRRSKVFPPLAGVSFAPINSWVFMTLILRSAIKRFGIYYPWMPVCEAQFLVETYRHKLR